MRYVTESDALNDLTVFNGSYKFPAKKETVPGRQLRRKVFRCFRMNAREMRAIEDKGHPIHMAAVDNRMFRRLSEAIGGALQEKR